MDESRKPFGIKSSDSSFTNSALQCFLSLSLFTDSMNKFESSSQNFELAAEYKKFLKSNQKDPTKIINIIKKKNKDHNQPHSFVNDFIKELSDELGKKLQSLFYGECDLIKECRFCQIPFRSAETKQLFSSINLSFEHVFRICFIPYQLEQQPKILSNIDFYKKCVLMGEKNGEFKIIEDDFYLYPKVYEFELLNEKIIDGNGFIVIQLFQNKRHLSFPMLCEIPLSKDNLIKNINNSIRKRIENLFKEPKKLKFKIPDVKSLDLSVNSLNVYPIFINVEITGGVLKKYISNPERERKSSYSLEEMFESYLSIYESNQIEQCPYRNEKSKPYIRKIIDKLPPILIFQIDKPPDCNFDSIKIEIPEYISISTNEFNTFEVITNPKEYEDDGSTNKKYELRSFIKKHRTNTFTATVKRGDSWYECNDTIISKAESKKTSGKEYIIFYQMIHGEKELQEPSSPEGKQQNNLRIKFNGTNGNPMIKIYHANQDSTAQDLIAFLYDANKIKKPILMFDFKGITYNSDDKTLLKDIFPIDNSAPIQITLTYSQDQQNTGENGSTQNELRIKYKDGSDEPKEVTLELNPDSTVEDFIEILSEEIQSKKLILGFKFKNKTYDCDDKTLLKDIFSFTNSRIPQEIEIFHTAKKKSSNPAEEKQRNKDADFPIKDRLQLGYRDDYGKPQRLIVDVCQETTAHELIDILKQRVRNKSQFNSFEFKDKAYTTDNYTPLKYIFSFANSRDIQTIDLFYIEKQEPHPYPPSRPKPTANPRPTPQQQPAYAYPRPTQANYRNSPSPPPPKNSASVAFIDFSASMIACLNKSGVRRSIVASEAANRFKRAGQIYCPSDEFTLLNGDDEIFGNIEADPDFFKGHSTLWKRLKQSVTYMNNKYGTYQNRRILIISDGISLLDKEDETEKKIELFNQIIENQIIVDVILLKTDTKNAKELCAFSHYTKGYRCCPETPDDVYEFVEREDFINLSLRKMLPLQFRETTFDEDRFNLIMENPDMSTKPVQSNREIFLVSPSGQFPEDETKELRIKNIINEVNECTKSQKTTKKYAIYRMLNDDNKIENERVVAFLKCGEYLLQFFIFFPKKYPRESPWFKLASGTVIDPKKYRYLFQVDDVPINTKLGELIDKLNDILKDCNATPNLEKPMTSIDQIMGRFQIGFGEKEKSEIFAKPRRKHY